MLLVVMLRFRLFQVDLLDWLWIVVLLVSGLWLWGVIVHGFWLRSVLVRWLMVMVMTVVVNWFRLLTVVRCVEASLSIRKWRVDRLWDLVLEHVIVVVGVPVHMPWLTTRWVDKVIIDGVVHMTV